MNKATNSPSLSRLFWSLALILVIPRTVFRDFQDNSVWVLPFLFVLVTGCAATFLEFQSSREFWTFEDISDVSLQPEDGTGARESPALNYPATTDQDTRVWLPIHASINAGLQILFALLILASYFWLIGKSFKPDLSWRKWWGFACWSVTPIAVEAMVKGVLIGVGKSNWIIGLAPFSWIGISLPWANLIAVSLLWSVFVTIQGLQCWGQTKRSISVIFVLIPYVLYVLLGSYLQGFTEAGS